ncbi:hypothetical protein NO559_03050 [Dasania sp. GY-MA-18]|uniref:Uncharacterized protein n=1 Tax=Dasania phycosphaerae TaxID=2950436 RepID=A0A9J6RII8_9GAMM|nr:MULTISPECIES: hypothetical protein [Dasania]MCR8921733.1 hypothetical protein [Dasania sp. GY-MA-18]MCZ0864161.1 hypothetical protein [Dasania phycosphaerae]MCZ0867889.1 hypothetical protein [Dasania phycosphaerae]
MKKLLLLALLLFALLAAWSYWQLDGFRSVTPKVAGSCQIINGVGAAADMAFNYRSGVGYMSVYDRLGGLQGDNQANGDIVVLDTQQLPGSYTIKNREGLTDFKPAGISLHVNAKGQGRLYVVNNRATGQDTIEVLSVAPGNQLVFEKTLKSDLFQGAIDVAAVGYDQFYVLTGPAPSSAIARYKAMLGFGAKSTLRYFDRGSIKTVVEGHSFLSSVAATANGHSVYLANAKGRSVMSYQRDLLSGELSYSQTVALAAAPEQLQLDEQGGLWVVGALRPLDYLRHLMSKGQKSSASELYYIATNNDLLAQPVVKMTSLGFEQSAMSSAVKWGSQVIVGSTTARNIQLCPYL